MFISIGIDEDGRPYITTSDGSREKVVRKGKGKSVIDFPSTYTVLDIETTGLDPRYCEIIEISAMKYSSGQNIGTFSTLVKPSEPIDEYITSLTGITNDMLKSAPDISEAMQKFYNFVGSDLIVGYNVNFDINFLYDNLLNCRSLILSNSFIDVMRIARKILPGLKNHKQATVADHYGISTAGAHRAAVDCEICNAIFEKLQANILATGQSLEDFKLSSKRSELHAKDISTENISFDTSHPLFGKVCVFTGTLEKMSRKDAMQLVVDFGGSVGDNVTKKTNYLILGNNDFCQSIKDGKSNKQKKAEDLILKGHDIEILSENVFYDLVLEGELYNSGRYPFQIGKAGARCYIVLFIIPVLLPSCADRVPFFLLSPDLYIHLRFVLLLLLFLL